MPEPPVVVGAQFRRTLFPNDGNGRKARGLWRVPRRHDEARGNLKVRQASNPIRAGHSTVSRAHGILLVLGPAEGMLVVEGNGRERGRRCRGQRHHSPLPVAVTEHRDDATEPVLRRPELERHLRCLCRPRRRVGVSCQGDVGLGLEDREVGSIRETLGIVVLQVHVPRGMLGLLPGLGRPATDEVEGALHDDGERILGGHLHLPRQGGHLSGVRFTTGICGPRRRAGWLAGRDEDAAAANSLGAIKRRDCDGRRRNPGLRPKARQGEAIEREAVPGKGTQQAGVRRGGAEEGDAVQALLAPVVRPWRNERQATLPAVCTRRLLVVDAVAGAVSSKCVVGSEANGSPVPRETPAGRRRPLGGTPGGIIPQLPYGSSVTKLGIRAAALSALPA